MTTPGSGEGLYELVHQYAALGEHRTGSDVDRDTVAWFVELLRAEGLEVRTEDLPFDRWVGESRLLVDGEEVHHLPVHYEFTGSIATNDVEVTGFDPVHGGFPHVLDAAIDGARASGRSAAVLATRHVHGSLVAVNRASCSAGSGFPTMLVAGRDEERLRSGTVELELTGRIERGTATNVVAGNGIPGRPALVTTPLNGWFRCAGERGTGVAVTVDLARRLRDRPLVVVATGGHELGFFGVSRWTERAGDVLPAGVLHVGASVAVEETAPEGGRRLASTRTAMTSLEPDAAAEVAAELASARLSLTTAATTWIGEGKVWSRLSCPVLSLSGAGVDFHTPEDVPERVTSPEALACASAAIGAAADAFFAHTALGSERSTEEMEGR